MGLSGSFALPVLRTVTMRIESRIREGERPRETPSFGIRSELAKLGTREDARPPIRKQSVFNPCSIRG
jgi:hypothetical protein